MQVQVGDVILEVEVAGSGDAIVLLHGFPLSHAIWKPQIEALQRRARVVAPDLRGAGGSSSPGGPYLMETLAGDLAELLDVLQIDRASIVGHSMGGYVAMAFARMYAESVAKLSLVCSRLCSDTAAVANDREKLAREVLAQQSAQPLENAYITRLFSPQTLENNDAAVRFARELCRANSPAGLAGALRGMAQRADAYDIAGDLEMPVLVVAGADDTIVRPEEARDIAAAFPNAELCLLEGSGHLPMLEQPEALTGALERFLG